MTSSDSNLTVSWKRPWTIEEILQSSQCWSLAADSGVCELLKSFSTDLLNEVGQVNNNINELSVESKQTNVIIQNAFNEFCMLANNQFMENLVEDVASCPIANETSKTNNGETSCPSKEDKLAQIIPQVTESLKMGLQVLENQFEMIDITQKAATTASAATNPVESDDTEMRSYAQVDYLTNEPIYHPKDPYENRHLPHLIGTKAFIEDETLGIGYLDDLENNGSGSGSAAPSENGGDDDDNTISDGLTSEDGEEEESQAGNRRIKSSSESGASSGGMFPDEENSQSETDLFDDNNKGGNSSIKKPADPISSSSKPLSLMDQLNNQLKQRLGVENIDKSNEQMENSFHSDDDDNEKNDFSSLDIRNDDSRRKLPLQLSTNHHITRPVSGNSADDDSDDLFGDISTSKTKVKVESKSVSNSITQIPPSVVSSTPNKVDSNTNVKQKENPKSKKAPNSDLLFDSDSDSDGLFSGAPVVSKPRAAANTKSSSNPNTTSKESINRAEKENQNLKETSIKITPNKMQPKSILDDDDDDDDDLFGPKLTKPAKSAAPIVKPLPKKTNVPVGMSSGLFNSDDDTDLFDTTTPSKSHSKAAEKSNNATNLPKVESDSKINTQKNEPPISKPSFNWLDTSSDDDMLLLPKPKVPAVSKHLNNDEPSKPSNNDKPSKPLNNDEPSKPLNNDKPSKPLNNDEPSKPLNNDEPSKPLNNDEPSKELNHVSNNQEDREIKLEENIKSEDISEETIQTNNSNNNLEEFNEEKNSDNFDTLFITDKKEDKPGTVGSKKVNIATVETTNVANNSKVIDPLAPPKRKISFNISNNSDEDDPIKPPVIVQRRNINNNLQSSANAGVLDASSTENSNSNQIDIVSDVKPSRESLPKLPPGAKPLFGISLMNEMRIHQNSKLSLNSESEPAVKDSSHLFTPDNIDLFESSETQTQSNTQSNKQDFKNKLQQKLNEKLLFTNPIERMKKTEISEENGIDLEIPPEEVNQLTLLTKSRVKANPRRRPTMKKVGNVVENTIPALEDPVIPETKTDSIPQPIVDSVPIIVSNQSNDTSNIFADLPSKPIKKSKSNKKSTAPSINKIKKPIDVNAEEIDDIFTVPTSKPKKNNPIAVNVEEIDDIFTVPTTKPKKINPIAVNVEEIDDIFTVATSKPKKAKNKSKIVSDPLGAL